VKNYWYIAKPDEIFVDLDGDRANRLQTVLARIRGIMEGTFFEIQEVWMFPSNQDNHFHIVARSRKIIPAQYRFALQLYFFSDVFRTCNNLVRHLDCPGAYDVLISRLDWKNLGFYRWPDATCNCEEKHSHNVMTNCTAAKDVRGQKRDKIYFDKPIDPENFFLKKFGKITR
jgi:hypothetical protein